jgi:signal transduction histidine kinase/CheY-like chemotaxis protein
MTRVVSAVLTIVLGVPLAAAQTSGPSPAPISASPARSPEAGRPFVRVYRPYDVGGASQVWNIVQDKRGILYFGVGEAVLEFDGSTWRRIRLEAGGVGRSLDIDANGRIYVGSSADLGYLAADAHGEMRFVSLLNRLPKGSPPVTDIWRLFATDDGVLFQTDHAIYRWANDQMTVILPTTRFARSAYANKHLYVVTPESGLNVLEGTTLRPLPGTSALRDEPFPLVFRYDDRRLLIGTRRNGLFLYDGASLVPFKTELDDYLKSAQVYRGTELPDGTFVLTTITNGVAFIDRTGRRLMQLGAADGLPSDAVYYAMLDREGGFWLTTDNGIARVEISSPVSFFNAADGVPATIAKMTRRDGQLFLSTSNGVEYFTPASGTGRARFEPVSGVVSQCWDFAEVPDPSEGRSRFALACSSGFFEINGTRAVPVEAPSDLSFKAAVLRASAVDRTRVWVGLFDGLASFRLENGRWVNEGRVPGVSAQVRTLQESADGSVWAGTAQDGMLKISFASPLQPGQPRPPLHIDQLGEAQGLPAGGAAVDRWGGTLYFTAGPTDHLEVFRFDEPSKRFVRDKTFNVVSFHPVLGGIGPTPGLDGRVYVNWGRETAVMHKRPDGTWDVDRSTFARFGTSRPAIYLYAEPNGVVWTQEPDLRLVRTDTRSMNATPPPPVPFVRRVSTAHDDLLFGGAGSLGSSPRLNAASNALRFEFAAPTFIADSGTEFESRLDGLDQEWSPWSTDTRRDYTNLGYGNYRFHVRARGVGGDSAQDSTFAFTILPPWYRTWWAKAAYALLAGLTFVLAATAQRRRVVAKERQRAEFNEAKVRTEAAEAMARAEREGKKNVELISTIGREITASLDFDTIFVRLYARLNELADADVFGVGLYDAQRNAIDYRLAMEGGKRYAPYSRDMTDRNQLPVWCIEHREPVFVNDLSTEYSKYITSYTDKGRLLEDGTTSRQPQSIIYVPLIAKEHVLGLVTIQSFQKHAYNEHHLNVMQSLASYTAIALDNANAYRQLNEHEVEIRRLFEEAERARGIAVEADAAKSAFLSTVSHELRTPLTSVLGFAKIIKRRLEDRVFPLVQSDDKKVKQTIQQIEDNLGVVVSEGERLTKLIDDVLDLAKIEAGKLEWHMEPVAIGEIVDRATAATASLFDQKGLRMIREVDEDLPQIIGDRDRLIQVVINLISNAVKFTDTGSVTCLAERRGGDIIVSVIDTGLGISPSDQPKVFERFKQVGDTLTDKPKGTGLGLPICKEIVEHHAGHIWVESAIGKGSTFSFSLPLQAGAPVQEGRSTPPPPIELAALIRQLRDQVEVAAPRTTERQPHILVVDDDANIRELLTQEFTEAGYSVAVAGDGREALAQVRRERPDLILLDVMMPEMNGFDVAAVLKNDPTTMEIPIVILSIVEDRDRGFRLGVDRYLTKPIDTDLLFREVGSLIEQRKSHKRVLIVDEDETTLRSLSDVLTARGYSVQDVRSDELMQRAIAMQPDIILLNSTSQARAGAVQTLRFEKGLENVVFLVYQ